ncbi:MAG: sensor domain-containing diguanylate cyclase [Acidobacteria bacterium]|nr:MAG: sensor domain-containing diguanylate cyclase [Acidobacteriota bacterium]
MTTTFFEKRIPILFLHWSVVLLTASILFFGDPAPGFTLNNWIILLFLSGHAALSIWRPLRFEDRSLVYLLILADVGGACLAAWLSGLPGSVFYVLLFVSMILAARVTRLELLGAFSVMLGLTYPAIVSLGGWPLEDVHWLAALLIGDCTLFFGYLAQLHRTHEEQKDAGSTYRDLSEFARALSREDDTEELHSRIPRLMAQIMAVDNCELALIEDDKITKRILPNRHCRDFQNIEIVQSVHERAVASSGVVYVADEMQADSAFISKKDFSLYPYRAYMGKAWMVQKKPAGVLALYMGKKGPWSEYSKQQFQFLVDHSALALQNLRLKLELENQARTDGLTELANHRYFYERLEEEFERARRKNHFLSVALIDLDHFKKLNDSAGHRVGDQVLQSLSELFRKSIRRIDLAGRLGGDEFAIALPETTSEDALMLCRRILDAAARRKVGQLTGFSLSIGCATCPADGETLSELIEHADQALYYSKNLGRGRVSRYADVVGQRKTT